MRSTAVFLLLFFLSVRALSQAPLNSVSFASPNAAQLGSYGQVKVNYFNGLPNISVPIHSFQFGEVALPVSLGYHGGGIKKEERPTWVGLGWNLFVGGAITRIANGKIDEYYSGGNSSNSDPGYYSFLYNKGRLLGDNWITNNAGNPNDLDLAPDEFQFNFNGMSGAFVMDGTGVFRVKSDLSQDLKIEYELMQYPELVNYYYPGRKAHIPRVFYKFTITAADGIKYIFGNDKDAIEYSRTSDRSKYFGSPDVFALPNDDGAIIASSWYLKEIVLTNGQKLSFNYARYGYQMVESRYFERGYHQFSGCSSSGSETLSGGHMWNRNLINSVYLKNITAFDGTSVDFEFSESNQLGHNVPIDGNGQTFFEGYLDLVYSDRSLFKNKMMQLNKILIKYKEDVKKVVKFEYTNSSAERLKLLRVSLADITETVKQTYVFDYNPLKLPGYNSGQSDHWGYYNKDNYFFDVYNVTTSNAASYYPTYLQYLEPDATKAQAEVLTKITYPTGGTTNFFYELNQYASQVVPATGSFGVENLQQNKYCGGIRIAKVESDPGNSGTPMKTEYKYVKNYNARGELSSGILSGKPGYWIDGTYKSSGTTATGIGSCTIDHNFWIFSTIGYEPLSNTNGSPITYSEVAEIYADNSYKIYKYSNHDNAMYVDQYPANLSTGFTPSSTNSLFYKTLCFTKMEFERGQLLKELSYTPSNDLKQEVTYTYNIDPSRYASYGRAVETYRLPLSNMYGTFAIIKSVSCTKKYLFNPNVTKVETKNYEHNGTIVTTAETLYDQYRNVSERKYVNSKGELKQDKFTYPYNLSQTQDLPSNCTLAYQQCWDDCASLPREEVPDCKVNCMNARDYCIAQMEQLSKQSNIYRRMTDAHVLVPVVEQRTILTKDGVSYIRSAALTTYQEPFSNLFEQHKTFTWESKALTPLGAVTPTTFSYTKGLVYDQRYKEKGAVVAYDSRGNILQVTPNKGKETSYLWGYNQVYPIAEATNAKSNEIFFDSFEEAGSWSGSVAPQHGDRPITGLDNVNVHTGRSSAKIEKLNSGEQYSHSTKTLNISLTEDTKFKFSGWVYSNGPSADIFLFMKRADETFYYTYVDNIYTNVTGRWVYVEKDIIVKQDVKQLNVRIDNNGGGTVWFDDIRLHPSSSFMVTYTYDPLTGMTSQSDINNKVTFYEYDEVNRLLQVKDENKNILKRYCYNYSGQAESCTIYKNATRSKSFIKQCSDGTGSSVVYTVKEGAYFSTVSPDAANLRADIEIDAKGQAYANQVGTCTYYNDDQSREYFSQNCFGQEPVGYYVSVPAGSFNSTTSKQHANDLAQQYGQDQANQYGSCQDLSSYVTVSYSNYTSSWSFVVEMQNVNTGEYFYFQMGPNYGLLGDVPSGTYNISIYDSYNSWNYYWYEAGCGYYASGTYANFYWVDINDYCSNITVSY